MLFKSLGGKLSGSSVIVARQTDIYGNVTSDAMDSDLEATAEHSNLKTKKHAKCMQPYMNIKSPGQQDKNHNLDLVPD